MNGIQEVSGSIPLISTIGSPLGAVVFYIHFYIDRISFSLFGGIAQLGERLNGIQEVSGSIPLISTRHVGRLVFYGIQAFLFII